MFSPAFLASALVWSVLPSACSFSLPVTLPAASLALPARSWAAFLILSAALMVLLLRGGLSRPASRGLPAGARPPCTHEDHLTPLVLRGPPPGRRRTRRQILRAPPPGRAHRRPPHVMQPALE